MVGALALLIVAAIVVLAVQPLSPKRSESGPSGASETAAPPTPPVRTTAVPAPSGGSVSETISPAPPAKTYKADSTDKVEIPGQVQIHLTGVKQYKKPRAIGPGALAGPVIVVSLDVTNKQADAVGLGGIAVVLQYRGNQVATPVQSELGKPLRGSLEPGKTASGAYVFSVPRGVDSNFVVLVQYGPSNGVARFRTS